MDALIGILQSLGVNNTVWVQIALFAVVVLFIKNFVFNPYMMAFEERLAQTTGSQDEAEKVIAATRELESNYQRLARTLNLEIKSAYDKEKAKAQAEHERIVLAARDNANEQITGAKKLINEEYMRAREELLKETSMLGDAMVAQLVAKD
jgi:F0F1-type ATP synthase membrane subunit b/b'